MNRIIKYISVLLMPLIVASCAGEKLRTQQEDGREGVVRFSLSSALRAVGDESKTHPTPALDREKSVDKLYAVVYRTSSGLHYKTVECIAGSTAGTYEFDNEKSGDFYFFLVANPDAALTKALNAGPSTPEDLGKLVATQTPGDDNTATNFLMTSEQVNVKVQSKQSTTLSNPIKLVRVAARFDFYNKIEDLVINKITFGKRYTTTHLFAQVKQMDELTFTEDKTYEGTLFQNGALTATVYGYETDTRNETFFTVEATYKGKPLKPETVRLENFVIKRNHLYNIILHELGGAVDPNEPGSEFGKLKYEIKVADWEEGDHISLSEDEVQKPLIVEYDAELANAPYMTPYLKNSQKDIYTTTKEATEVTIKLHTYVREGALAFAEGYIPEAGISLEETGTAVKDATTGRITRTYKLTLPKRDGYVAFNNFDASDKLTAPKFFEIPLEAKNFSGETTKAFTVKHGRIKMPTEYFSETPLNKAGDGFATSPNKISEIGYFAHLAHAVKNFKNCTINGKQYHMPADVYELTSLFPPARAEERYAGEGPEVKVRKENSLEWVVFPGWLNAGVNKKNYISKLASDYRTDKANHVSYGLRFKNEERNGLGNMLCMAYRFEWVGDFQRVDWEDDVIPSYFKVTTRYLGANWDGNVDVVADETFWNANKESDVSRMVYALDNLDPLYEPTEPTYDLQMGTKAQVLTAKAWTNDKNSDVLKYAYAALFEKTFWASNMGYFANRDTKQWYLKDVLFPIWLFSNE
ncbi:hypothetical protein Tsumi_12490 [Porphyromonas miyakawae]|uniref:Major fimbrial subunit protein N-terminal domain-containing protein n=1 Tax=Porphyromonas miyakawae TaxID=3137470 RepID=A0ABQ0E351_9PORP